MQKQLTIKDIRTLKTQAENQISEILDKLFDTIGFVPTNFNFYADEINKEFKDKEDVLIGYRCRMDIGI